MAVTICSSPVMKIPKILSRATCAAQGSNLILAPLEQNPGKEDIKIPYQNTLLPSQGKGNGNIVPYWDLRCIAIRDKAHIPTFQSELRS